MGNQTEKGAVAEEGGRGGFMGLRMRGKESNVVREDH
jgi:hypothetical protein